MKFAADHGVSLAFYFDDPDGNMIRCTGILETWGAEPYNLSWKRRLSEPEEILLRKVAPRLVRPTGPPMEPGRGKVKPA